MKKPFLQVINVGQGDCMIMRPENKCTLESQRQHAFLFTGDADKTVFRRLMKKKNRIESTFLKVPHHGSKHSMNQRILKYIDPKYAIISHGNAMFGRCKDAHPHSKVINLLENDCVRIYPTNDVIKNGHVVLKKNPNHPCCFFEIT